MPGKLYRCTCCGDVEEQGDPCRCAYQQCEGGCWNSQTGCSEPKRIPIDFDAIDQELAILRRMAQAVFTWSRIASVPADIAIPLPVGYAGMLDASRDYESWKNAQEKE